MLIVLVLLTLRLGTDFYGALERRFYDFASTSTARQPSDRIAIIAIDDQSIANIGRWPWPRDVHARLIDKLAAAKAKTIVQTTFFFEPQTDRGLDYIRRMKDLLATGTDAALPPSAVNEQLGQVIAQAETALDTDSQLSASIQRAGNVLLPSVYVLGIPQGRPDRPLPNWAMKSTLEENSGFSQPSVSGQQPLDMLGSAALGVGHMNQVQDPDGTVRQEALLVNYFGLAVPSMSLLAAASSLNLRPEDIRINPGDSVQIGKLRIQTDLQAQMRPQFYLARDGKSPFPIDSFSDVLNDKVPASKYAGKIVLIGATATGLGTQLPVPGHPGATPVEVMAHITSSILSEHFIVEPYWGTVALGAIVLLIAAYLIAGLPRLSAGMAAMVTAGLMLALLGTEFGLLASANPLWLPMVFPAVLLLLGHLALTTKRFLMTEAGKVKADEESAETNRMMGLALQGQGQLDMAFDRFGRAPMSDALMDNLYNLALDFERKRQFNKALAVYEHMSGWNKDYKDLPIKLNRAKNLSTAVLLGTGAGGSHPGGTMLLDSGAVEKPMLGRYQVEKELGKGAMGVVYLGKDPKIGRVVAIKTLALSNEFEGEELKDARERFFREAETAGRLQHQNIVTIFDAGEEHDLAYIAMEFLKGRDLVANCKEGNLLPVPMVLSIVARVAEALDYAHQQNVVHRDIKPANIMFDPDSDSVKVTDFGIARITDSSKTKTGLVLGTPSFMSPEQLAGKKIDGRSDLYSLGVMLFQMLAGVLPFRGESMAELMYKIANEAPPDIGNWRQDLPPQLGAIVRKAMGKDVMARYQNGKQFAAELRSVLRTLSAPTASQAASANVPLSATEAAPQSERTQPLPAQDTAAFTRTTLYQPESANTAKPGAAQDSD